MNRLLNTEWARSFIKKVRSQTSTQISVQLLNKILMSEDFENSVLEQQSRFKSHISATSSLMIFSSSKKQLSSDKRHQSSERLWVQMKKDEIFKDKERSREDKDFENYFMINTKINRAVYSKSSYNRNAMIILFIRKKEVLN
jgi:hypothetical protein